MDAIDPNFQAVMSGLAGAIDKVLNPEGKENGFILFTFPFNGTPDARVNYMSNAGRGEMVVMVKEWLARQEGGILAETATPL